MNYGDGKKLIDERCAQSLHSKIHFTRFEKNTRQKHFILKNDECETIKCATYKRL